MAFSVRVNISKRISNHEKRIIQSSKGQSMAPDTRLWYHGSQLTFTSSVVRTRKHKHVKDSSIRLNCKWYLADQNDHIVYPVPSQNHWWIPVAWQIDHHLKIVGFQWTLPDLYSVLEDNPLEFQDTNNPQVFNCWTLEDRSWTGNLLYIHLQPSYDVWFQGSSWPRD